MTKEIQEEEEEEVEERGRDIYLCCSSNWKI